jgi:P pilus assembly chaperone PapD
MRFFLIGLLWVVVNCASANVVINGTRVIYPLNSKETVVQLINNGNDPALVQSWIDDGDINSTPETSRAPFLLSPPVVKVAGKGGQQLRIKKLPAILPTDRESVFYLNVLDVPPVPEDMQGMNTMQLAIKSRIKLFVRPEQLRGGIDKAIEKVDVKAEGQGFRINNKSPFFITIANIEGRNKKMMVAESLMLSPFSNAFTQATSIVKKGQHYSLRYVNDLGAFKQHDFVSQ